MGEVAQSEKGPIYFMAPYRILVDAVGGGGSLWFHFKGKEAALHFAVAADAAKAGEILNEHFYEVLEQAADANGTTFCGHPTQDWLDLFHEFGGPRQIRDRLIAPASEALPPSGEPVQ